MKRKILSIICGSAALLVFSLSIPAKGITSKQDIIRSFANKSNNSKVLTIKDKIRNELKDSDWYIVENPKPKITIDDSNWYTVPEEERTSQPSSISGKVNLVRTSYASSVSLGKVSLNSSSRIVLNMPNNSRKDLMQGTITLTPVGGGSSKVYDFMNFYEEDWTINLSEISSGEYNATLKPTVYGTSNKATLYYYIG